MKLRILAAASALAVAGVAFAVYRETRPDTATTAAADSPTPVERTATPTPTPTPADIARPSAAPMAAGAPATSRTVTSGARTSAPAAPALPASAGARPDREAASLSSSLAQPATGSQGVTRRGLRSIKVRGTKESVDPAVARQERMNRAVESAACHAPGLEQRYRQLPENQRAALRARCAKYGVTLPDPS